ncbi:hypothetical protein [Hymenobacter sp. DG25A]|uniref:hypothetical protein n=1 Tax=Hymenobacter sp. DG25A TaxID=1385663 RepID=UPI0006BD69E8|nr:hypothetical protein [Hymenobacter sp. DG25A]ALD19917.1 hypothetical protein AM218_00040 [Hymenobacter sp. DG25A]
MRHRVLHHFEFLTLEYDALEEYIHAVWQGEQTDESIRRGYEQILYFLNQERCSRLLDNHEAIQGIWVSQASWFANEWYPTAVAAGMQRFVVVYARDYFSRRSTQEALIQIPGGLAVGYSDVEAARHALLAV